MKRAGKNPYVKQYFVKWAACGRGCKNCLGWSGIPLHCHGAFGKLGTDAEHPVPAYNPAPYPTFSWAPLPHKICFHSFCTKHYFHAHLPQEIISFLSPA